MKSFRTRNAFANPWLLWTDFAWKTGEMMMASAEVINHRAKRIAAAGPTPSNRDRRELALMGQEKIAAASESAAAIGARMMRMDPLLGLRAATQSMAVTSAMMSLASSRTVRQSIRRQAALMRTLARSGVSATKLSDVVAHAARAGLNPVHSRATANAKRLRKT